MNNTKSQTKGLQDSISWLNETANQGKEFVIDQAPLYAQEFLTYEKFSCITGVVLSVIFSVGLLLLTLIMVKNYKTRGNFAIWDFSDRYDRECPLFIAALSFLVFSLVISALSSLHSATEFTKVILSPRVVLLEHVSSLIN